MSKLFGRTRRLLIVLFVFLIFLWGAVCYQFLQMQLSTYSSAQQDSFLKASLILQEKLDSYIHGLQGMGGVVKSKQGNPSMRDVREYAEFRGFFSNFEGALGYGFIRRVFPDQLIPFLASKVQESSDFHFQQLTPTKDVYFIIEAIEPIERNRKALGLDIGSETKRRAAALRAMETGRPALTAPIELVQAKGKTSGFLYFLPVYQTTTPPSTSSQRQRSLIGWTYAPILADSILEHLGKNVSNDFHYSLFDVTDPSSSEKIFLGFNVSDSKIQPFKALLTVGERRWEFIAAPKVSTYQIQLKSLAILIFVTGIFFLTFFFQKFYKQLRRSDEVEVEYLSIEKWREAVLNGTNYMMIATRLDGTITVFNRTAEALLGYKADELVGKKTPGIFHDPVEVTERSKILTHELGRTIQPGFETFVTKAHQSGAPDINEWTYVTKSGEKFPVRLSVTAIRNYEGVISGYLGVAEDLREFKRLEQTIESQRLAMISSAKMSALGEMAGGVAHEINNPLTIINGKVSIIKHSMVKNPDISWLLEQLSGIENTVDRINKIIKGLRAFSRDCSRDEKKPTQVGDVISETLDLCREKFSKYGIDIIQHGDPSLLIICRSVEISQVLMNLLSNSFDALENRPDKWVKISILNKGNNVEILYCDSGDPIPKEIQQRMFEPFYTTKEVGKGTGIGLSISKGIMEAHGGSLTYVADQAHPTFKLIF